MFEYLLNWCLRPDLNRHGIWLPQDFKSCASTYSATKAQIMVSRWRFELQTPWLKVKCSTNWASEPKKWLGWQELNLRCGSQRPVPYHLATRHYYKWWREMDSNHRTRRNRFTVCRVWPLRYPSKQSGAGNRTWTHNLLIHTTIVFTTTLFVFVVWTFS